MAAQHLLAQQAQHMADVPDALVVFSAAASRRRRIERSKDGRVHPQEDLQCHRQNARLFALIAVAQVACNDVTLI